MSAVTGPERVSGGPVGMPVGHGSTLESLLDIFSNRPREEVVAMLESCGRNFDAALVALLNSSGPDSAGSSQPALPNALAPSEAPSLEDLSGRGMTASASKELVSHASPPELTPGEKLAIMKGECPQVEEYLLKVFLDDAGGDVQAALEMLHRQHRVGKILLGGEPPAELEADLPPAQQALAAADALVVAPKVPQPIPLPISLPSSLRGATPSANSGKPTMAWPPGFDPSITPATPVGHKPVCPPGFEHALVPTLPVASKPASVVYDDATYEELPPSTRGAAYGQPLLRRSPNSALTVFPSRASSRPGPPRGALSGSNSIVSGDSGGSWQQVKSGSRRSSENNHKYTPKRSTTEWHEERQADLCASRETVGQMKERRDKLNQAAIEASRRNDQHAAAQLRQQAQQVGREIKAQETMAAESTFVAVNARHTRPDGFHLLPPVDLHYLTVEAALNRLNEVWDTITKCPKAYGQPCLQP